MHILKYSAITIAALIVMAIVYGQGVSRADKKAVTSPPSTTPQKASKQKSMMPSTGVLRPDVSSTRMGAVSALPPDPKSPIEIERQAAYARSDAFRQQAQGLYETGDLAGAEAACFSALNSPPIVGGQPQHVPFMAHLLGQIYLKDGHYQKAIHWLGGARLNTTTVGGGLDLDLALAYARLGDYKNASRFYSDGATLQYHFAGKDVLPQDLPGRGTSNALEASILLACGMNAYYEARRDDALVDFQAANRLAPNNALIAYHCATILSEKGRFTEAKSLYARAATGRALIAEEANRHLGGFKAR